MKGKDKLYTADIENCPKEVKFKAKVKFADKFFVWCAISEVEISTPYVGKLCRKVVDVGLYTHRCLPKILNFISTYHQNDEIIF